MKIQIFISRPQRYLRYFYINVLRPVFRLYVLLDAVFHKLRIPTGTHNYTAYGKMSVTPDFVFPIRQHTTQQLCCGIPPLWTGFSLPYSGAGYAIYSPGCIFWIPVLTHTGCPPGHGPAGGSIRFSDFPQTFWTLLSHSHSGWRPHVRFLYCTVRAANRARLFLPSPSWAEYCHYFLTGNDGLDGDEFEFADISFKHTIFMTFRWKTFRKLTSDVSPWKASHFHTEYPKFLWYALCFPVAGMAVLSRIYLNSMG